MSMVMIMTPMMTPMMSEDDSDKHKNHTREEKLNYNPVCHLKDMGHNSGCCLASMQYFCGI
jgi:hypothetical protein